MIKLKGMRDSIIRCVIPEDIDASELGAAFVDVLLRDHGILPGSRVVLDFGSRALSGETVCAVMSGFVFPSGVEAVAWITYDAASQEMLKRAGLPTSEPAPAPLPEEEKQEWRPSPGKIVSGSLRSGKRIDYRYGDVIIAGHVNSGAEVSATGNITVLGHLRGTVHAGCEGDENVSVLARSMEALQIRIGGRVGSLDRGALWWGKMVIARVEDGVVLIDYWPAIKSDKAPKGVWSDVKEKFGI